MTALGRALGVVQPVYDRTIRPRLPRVRGECNGVEARQFRLLDFTREKPDYKQGVMTALDDHVDDGDHVVIVGGGWGISATRAVQAGAGHVTAYEAGTTRLPLFRETVDREGVADRVTLRHALVGESVNVAGELADADTVPPSRLDTGDVLVLDCEGAEHSILDELADWPDTLVVETHPRQDASSVRARNQLYDAGYAVTAREYEPAEENPAKHVLVGTLRGDFE